MRIAHIVEAWQGGIATYVSDLIEAQINQGLEVYLICDPRYIKNDSRPIQCEIIKYRAERGLKGVIFSSIYIHRILRSTQFDIIHSHSTFPGIYSRLAGRLDAKCFYTPHGWSFLKRDVGKLRRTLYKKIEAHLSKNCHRIICMSRQELFEAKAAGISEKKIRLLHTGIKELTFPKPLSRETSAKTVRVGFFGRLDEQKGFDRIADACHLFNDGIEVHVFGSVVRGNKTNTRSDPKLIFHEWIDHSAVPDALSSIDIVIAPSRWEGFAISPIEAMRQGIGVITTPDSSIPEIIIDGFNGHILPNSLPETIARAINELTLERCRKMGGNARIVYESALTQERFLREIKKIYEEN